MTTLEHDHIQRMRESMAAVRLSVQWFGTRRSVSPNQKIRAAETFEAETSSISMGKKLVNTKHPAWQNLAAVRRRIVSEWKRSSLPYPEDGIRLIKRDAIDAFTQRMNLLHEELRRAEAELNESYPEIRAQAKERLGDLYEESDYPATLIGLFDFTIDHPNIEPPAYLESVSPALYRQECERIRSRFTEAVHLAENAFMNEFSKLVAQLTDKLSGTKDGKPKKFDDAVVTKLNDFFDAFRGLAVNSNEELESLVAEAKRIVGDHTADDLRGSDALRTDVAGRLASVRETLDGMMVDRPRRKLIRRAE